MFWEYLIIGIVLGFVDVKVSVRNDLLCYLGVKKVMVRVFYVKCYRSEYWGFLRREYKFYCFVWKCLLGETIVIVRLSDGG